MIVRLDAVLTCCVLLLVAGCTSSKDVSGTHPNSSATDTKQQDSPQVASPQLREHEQWEAVFIKGSKVGYAHTTELPQTEQGQQQVKVDFEFHLFVNRFGDKSAPSMSFTSWETPTGELLRFKSLVSLGPTPMISEGKVQGDQLVIKQQSQGRTETNKIAWNGVIRGFYAMEQSLRNQPLKPGERRAFKSLHPVFHQVADVTLEAKQFETTKLLDGSEQLLRVESTLAVPGTATIPTTLWVNADGIPVKTRSSAMEQETYRTTREIATAVSDAPALDIGFSTTVPVKRPLPQIHSASSASYRVRLDNADPTETFLSGPSQQVRKIDGRTAEVTVKSLRPSPPTAGPKLSTETATPEDSAPNSLIQSDDATVQAMAQEATAGKSTPWEQAVAIESYVHEAIQEKNFSQAFATAAEVAQSREGDCTEHSVLLAALARASGIPARVAIGLVYSTSAGGFAFHMWNEVYVDEQWIPVDATLARGGIGAGHLKLGDSNLSGSISLASFLPVAQVMGQLEIESVDVP